MVLPPPPPSCGPRFRGRSRSYLSTLGLQLFLPQLWPRPGLLSPVGGGALAGRGPFLCPAGAGGARGSRPAPSFPPGGPACGLASPLLTHGVKGATKRSVLLPFSQGLLGPLPPLVQAGASRGRRAIPAPARRLTEEGQELPVLSGSPGSSDSVRAGGRLWKWLL